MSYVSRGKNPKKLDHEKYVFMALEEGMSSFRLSSLRRQSDVGQAEGGTSNVLPYTRFMFHANEN